MDLFPQDYGADVGIASPSGKEFKSLVQAFSMAPRVIAHSCPVLPDGNPTPSSTLPGYIG
eukprot:3890472-Amphidinium_carterae.2